MIREASRLNNYVCTRLGVITRLANAMPFTVIDPSTGDAKVEERRDSTAFRPNDGVRARRTPGVHTQCAPLHVQRPLTRRAKRERQRDAEAIGDARFVATWVAARTLTASSSTLSASDRLEAIRLRVAAKRGCT